MYTKKKSLVDQGTNQKLLKDIYHMLLCSPVFVPQIVGGLIPPPPLVTEKQSVRHRVLSVTDAPVRVSTMTPACLNTLLVDNVFVDGPAMTKLSKSSLI